MKIAIIGAGAVGCFFGAKLVEADADVLFMARAYQADLLNRDGLTVESGGARQTLRVRATAQLADIESADLVLLSVKSYHTADAAKQVAPHLPPETVVLSMQNGVGNAEVFRAESEHPALAAVVYVGAQMEGTTRVIHKGGGNVIIGAPRGHTQPGALDLATIAAELNRGFPCKVSDFIERDLWQKLIINCAYNAISAITQRQYGTMLADTQIFTLMEQIVHECVAVADKLGIPFEFDKLRSSVLEIGRVMGSQYSSTAQDLQRGKRTEIDALNGEVARLGAQHHIPTIANQAVYALVKLMERDRE